MNNKEFKKQNPFQDDMKKNPFENTEFGKEFINPFTELEETLQYTNGSLDSKVKTNRQIKHKK